MIIGIDIDDTITNSSKVIKRYLMKYLGHDVVKNNFRGIMRGNYVNDVLETFYSKYGIEMGNAIRVKKDAAEVINRLHDEGHKIVIVTARSNNFYGNAQEFCINYLNENGIKYDKLFTAQIYKSKLCIDENIDLMIDDSIDTVEEIKALGKKSILFTSALNKNEKCNTKRLNSWKEVYNYIQKINF